MMTIPKNFKILTSIIILTAVISGGYFLMRGKNLSMQTLFHPASGERLLISMEGFKFLRSENGVIAWRMNAKNADLYENKEALLKDIEIIFTSSAHDKKEATLLGESGTMDTVNGNASIRRGTRDVRVATSDGYLLTTNSLSWNAGERIVWTRDPFKLLGKEIYLEGIGISADVDMRKILVKDNVKAVLQE